MFQNKCKNFNDNHFKFFTMKRKYHGMADETKIILACKIPLTSYDIIPKP